MNFKDFLNESKHPNLPSDLNKSFLIKGTVKYKQISFTDDGDLFDGGVWVGKTKKGFGVVFYSFDFGTQSKVKTFNDESDAENLYTSIKDKLSYDNILKLFK